MRVASEVTSSKRMEKPTSFPSSQPNSSATLMATVVAATRRGYNNVSITMSSLEFGCIKGRAYLSDCNDLPISTPSCFLKELGYLRTLSRTGLTDDDGDRMRFDRVQQRLAMFGDGQKCRWLVQGGNETGVKSKIGCHFEESSKIQ